MITIKRIGYYLAIAMASLIGMLLLFVGSSVIPIDRTPYYTKDFYQEMQSNLDQLKNYRVPSARHGFKVGYSKVNITPSYPTSTAGYVKRRWAHFPSVHDSIYVRTMVISNGSEKVALVTADMLMIPPLVTALLKNQLPRIGFNETTTYLSATHTHNSIGNWGENLIGEIYAGPYDERLVQFIADKILVSIFEANQNLIPATLRAGTIPVSDIVTNRLADKEGRVDSLLRVIDVKRMDGSKLVMTSFTAHATCLYGRDLQLSRDYPGKLVDELEKNGYTFAMFMAGAVGSHGCKGPADSWEKIEYVGSYLAQTLLTHTDSLKEISDSTVAMIRVPLALGDPQVKVLKNWRVRPWLFRTFFGEYPSSLTALRIGDVVMLGTPCDFSGELTPSIDSVAKRLGLRAMVTSFNGGYIGYITRDKFYDRDHYETRLMNWFGPGNGAYLTENMITLMGNISNTNK